MSTPSQTTRTVQVDRMYIRATPQVIWDALTTPGWTSKYGLTPLVEYEPRSGSRFRALPNETMRALGMPDVVIDGEVIEADPPRKLVQTWRLLMDPRVAAEGFARLDYEIEEVRGGVTKLTVTHDVSGATAVTAFLAGEGEPTGGCAGWSQGLNGLKTRLETQGQMGVLGAPQNA